MLEQGLGVITKRQTLLNATSEGRCGGWWSLMSWREGHIKRRILFTDKWKSDEEMELDVTKNSFLGLFDENSERGTTDYGLDYLVYCKRSKRKRRLK